ncbi:hypothetical protein DIPPA_08498 [Diplonema papillatum]|nr:hypothetical protein DIPPA_08498 [Diplonema papillatum]|eukprot:gene10093-15515_t
MSEVAGRADLFPPAEAFDEAARRHAYLAVLDRQLENSKGSVHIPPDREQMLFEDLLLRRDNDVELEGLLLDDDSDTAERGVEAQARTLEEKAAKYEQLASGSDSEKTSSSEESTEADDTSEPEHEGNGYHAFNEDGETGPEGMGSEGPETDDEVHGDEFPTCSD